MKDRSIEGKPVSNIVVSTKQFNYVSEALLSLLVYVYKKGITTLNPINDIFYISRNKEKVVESKVMELIHKDFNDENFDDDDLNDLYVIVNQFARRDASGKILCPWTYNSIPIDIGAIERFIEQRVSKDLKYFFIRLRAFSLSPSEKIFDSQEQNIFYKYYKQCWPNYYEAFDKIGVKRLDADEEVLKEDFMKIRKMVDKEVWMTARQKIWQCRDDDPGALKYIANEFAKVKKADPDNRVENDPYYEDDEEFIYEPLDEKIAKPELNNISNDINA